MTLPNARTGNSYELVLEMRDGTWRGTWRTLASGGTPIEGPEGSTQATDASDVFARAQRAIETADPDVVGVDWDFSEPLPPWLAE